MSDRRFTERGVDSCSRADLERAIAKDISSIEKEYRNREITPHNYRSLMRESVSDRSRAEWKKLFSHRAKIAAKKEVAQVVAFLLVIVALSMFAFFKPFVGFVTISEQVGFEETVGERFSGNASYTFELLHPGSLSSLSISGSLSKDGVARVYADVGNESYLVYDSSYAGLSSITGLVVDDGEVENESTVAEVALNVTLDIRLIAPDRLVAHTDEYFTYSVETDSVVDTERLCSIWSVNSKPVACQGAVDCCGFVGLEAVGSWDAPFYLTADRYAMETMNTISSRLVHYALDLEAVTSDIRYSDVEYSTAEFIERRIVFEGRCVESCLLNVNASLITFRVEVDAGTLDVDSVHYTVLQEFNISLYPPVLVQNFSNRTWYAGDVHYIDLNDYFVDEDRDALNYSYFVEGIVDVVLDGSIVTITTEEIGRGGLYFTATDGHYSATSPVMWIDVVSRPASMDDVDVVVVTEKPKVRLNEPVRWVTFVNSSEDVINLSVNISSAILNISVIDLSDNRSLEKVVVRDAGRLKNLSLFRAEKRIDHIEKIEERLANEKLALVRDSPTAISSVGDINRELVALRNEKNVLTGYVVASTVGDGLLPRFFAWLKSVTVTGFAIADTSSDAGVSEVIIGEIASEVAVEYYTEAPRASERMLTNTTKEVVISSDVHYEDIVAYSSLPREIEAANVILHWITPDGRVEVDFVGVDRDHNGLLEEIEWVVPHLSNQTYEISLTILNVQSYPALGGEWTVKFETSGNANLTIFTVNGTRYREMTEDNPYTQDDLKLNTLRCGEDVLFDRINNFSSANSYLLLENGSLITLAQSVDRVYAVAGYSFLDYSCNTTGRHTVDVITEGRHYQNITFGNITSMAQNSASGIACRLSVAENWGEGCYVNVSFGNTTNTCIDLSGDSQISTADRCHNVTECIDHLGASCDYYSDSTLKGICARNGYTSATCSVGTSSGEYGDNLTGGVAVNFHSGNENSSCTAGSEGMICADSSASGYQPNGTGVCVSSACSSAGIITMSCKLEACAVSDISSANYFNACSGTEGGFACDSSINGSGFLQDGQCDGSSVCWTSGYLCNGTAGSIYADACSTSCSNGDFCDATLRNGNFDPDYGTCDGSSCVASGSNIAPTLANATLNNTLTITTHDDLYGNVTFTDANGDNGSVHFTWFLNGTAIFNETIQPVLSSTIARSNLSRTNLTKGLIINFSVYANDSSDNSTVVNSQSLTVANGAPVVTAPIINTSTTISRANVTANTTYTDIDGDNGNVTIYLSVSGRIEDRRTVYHVVSGGVVVVNFSYNNYMKNTVIVSYANATDATNNVAAIKGTNATVTNTPSNVSRPGINNSAPNSNDDLYGEANYSDYDGDTGTANLYWRVNNVVVQSNKFIALGASGATVFSTLDSANFNRNDKINLTVVANDTEDNTTITSLTLTVANGPPLVQNISFNFATFVNPFFNSSENASINATFIDNDGDNGSLTFTWYLNATAIFNETIFNLTNGTFVSSNLSLSFYNRTDEINVTIVANDSTDISDTYWSDVTTIANGYPSVGVPLLNNTQVKAKDIVGVNVTVTDPDGDTSNVTFALYVNSIFSSSKTASTILTGGTAVGNFTGVLYSRGNTVYVTATAKDTVAGTSPAVASAEITIVNSPPVADNVTLNDSNVRSVDDLWVQANYSDDDGDGGSITFRWYVNGTPARNETVVSLTQGSYAISGTFSASNFSKGDVVNVSATADDTFDNGTPVFSETLTILNSPPFINNSLLTLSVGQNTPKSITLLQYYADQDGDPMSFNVTGNTSSTVNVVINQTTSIATFTPALDYTGSSIVTIGFNDSEYYFSEQVRVTVAASSYCGDGYCGGGEATSCKADCDWCGDGTCNGAETCSNCMGDCGTCPVSYSPAPPAPAAAAPAAAPAAAAASVSLASPGSKNGLQLGATTLPCRRVSGGKGGDVSIHQSTVEETDVPEGFQVVLDPFRIQCAGHEIDFTVSIPEQYVNLTMLRCTGDVCVPTLINVTSRLECFDSDTGKFKRTELEADTTDVNLSEGNVTVDGVEFVARNETVEEAVNEFLKIIGNPSHLRIEDTGTSTLTLAYLEDQTKNIDIDGLQIFARQNDEWNPLGGVIDKDAGTVTAEIESIEQYLDNESVGLFTIMGTICEFCVNSSFEKVYNGTSRDAVLLVHGFTSSPDTFEDIIADIELTEQPFQTWTYGYSSTRTIDDITQDLMDSIELNVEEFDNLYIAAHSLGGIVAQKTLYDAFVANNVTQKYTFIPKVKKVILVGVPNEGAAFLENYLKVYKFLVNKVSKYNNLFNVNNQLIDLLKEGLVTPRLPGVDYFVIAGTNTQQFGNLLEIDATNETHDGLVTIKSAQRIGDEYINNRCTNYWDINVTHTGLIDQEVSRKLIEKIIAREIIAAGVETAVGNTLYYDLHIDACSSKDRYILVGQRISDDATFDATGCKCGNGVCGQGEDELNCPIDCFKGFSFKTITPKQIIRIFLLILASFLLNKAVFFTLVHTNKSFARFWKVHKSLNHYTRKKRVEEAHALYRELNRHYLVIDAGKHNFLLKRYLWKRVKRHRKRVMQFDHPLFKMKMLRKVIRGHLKKGNVHAARKAHDRMHVLYVGHFMESSPNTLWEKPWHYWKLMWRQVLHPHVHLKHHYTRMCVRRHLKRKK
ncbi:MAG: hypothetical protein O2779_00285 [Nanoarchaeota archaeon]|nr:hypothetical protein [Nanoarchaeota archaeon]